MNDFSNLELWGRLRIYENDVLVFDDKNTILNVGKIQVLNILADVSSDYIAELAIGNGNSPNGSVDVDSTALINEIDSKAFSSVLVDSEYKIIDFRATFNSADYSAGSFSPEEINEAALKFNSGKLFSKKNFIARPFAIVDSVTMTFLWSIGVS